MLVSERFVTDCYLVPLLKKQHRWKLVIFPLHCILWLGEIRVTKLRTIKPFIDMCYLNTKGYQGDFISVKTQWGIFLGMMRLEQVRWILYSTEINGKITQKHGEIMHCIPAEGLSSACHTLKANTCKKGEAFIVLKISIYSEETSDVVSWDYI